MNLVDFGKICGILFFVVMCWYFIFVVFKTNKDYLRSLAGMDVVEGFSDDQNTKLENRLTYFDAEIKKVRDEMGLGEGGKEEQRKLILDYFEKSLRMFKLYLINMKTAEATNPKMAKMIGLEEQEKVRKNIKICEDAITYFSEEQTISENEGLI